MEAINPNVFQGSLYDTSPNFMHYLWGKSLKFYQQQFSIKFECPQNGSIFMNPYISNTPPKKKHLYTLPETNIAPENKPFGKGYSYFAKPPFLGG